MDKTFKALIEGLHPTFERLLAMESVFEPPLDMPKRGVYLFSENGAHLYVGRSNTMRKRYKQHTNRGSPHNQASFAYKLACEKCNIPSPTYKKGDGQSERLKNPILAAEFFKAKERVLAMDYRYVEEADPTRQSMLEAYACIALETPYNNFENH
ncbi:MAG: hypothetical protein ABJ081_05165 [Hyphomicrobiales bacterium]